MTPGRGKSTSDIVRRRLSNQALAGSRFDRAPDVVRWLGAVQAQDFPAATWALGQRTTAAAEQDVIQEFGEGTILRTHVLRPTWHFVVPDDIRWMLALSAPRVKAASAYQHRRLGLTAPAFRRSSAVFEKVLGGGHQLTRSELAAALTRGRARHDPLIVGYLLMAAELDGVICSGALRGKQHTYALFEERVPAAPPLTRDESLARLAHRYFASHGPATLRDFAWWSGLLVRDARLGLELARPGLACEVINGQTYWCSALDERPTQPSRTEARLLPNYDEYIVAYAERGAVLRVGGSDAAGPRGSLLFTHTILVDGRVVGTWRRSAAKDAVTVTVTLTDRQGRAAKAAIRGAAERYATFLQKSLQLAYAE